MASDSPLMVARVMVLTRCFRLAVLALLWGSAAFAESPKAGLAVGGGEAVGEDAASGALEEDGEQAGSLDSDERAAEEVPEDTAGVGSTEAESENPSTGWTTPAPPEYPLVSEARQAIEQGNDKQALEKLEAAYREMYGRADRAEVLVEIGRCQERLGDFSGAVRSYERYLEETGAAGARSEEARERLEELKSRLGSVKISVGIRGSGPLLDYRVWVDGKPVAQQSGLLYLRPGEHELQVRSAGHETVTRTITISSGTTQDVFVAMSPRGQEYDGLHPAYFWTSAGATLVTLATGAAFGLSALGARGAVDEALDGGPPESLSVTEEDQEHIANLALTADVFLISSGVLAIGSVILGLNTDFRRNKPKTEAATWNAGVLPGGGMLMLEGAF